MIRIELNRYKNSLFINNNIEMPGNNKFSWKNEEVDVSIFNIVGDFNVWLKMKTEKINNEWITILQTRTKSHNGSNPSEKFIINEYFSNFVMIKEWLEINKPEIYKEAKCLF